MKHRHPDTLQELAKQIDNALREDLKEETMASTKRFMVIMKALRRQHNRLLDLEHVVYELQKLEPDPENPSDRIWIKCGPPILGRTTAKEVLHEFREKHRHTVPFSDWRVLPEHDGNRYREGLKHGRRHRHAG